MEAPVSDEEHGPERRTTFTEVFAESEYRALFTASALVWVGDYIARAAVTILVYQQTSSVALSAAAFAVSYLPWLVGGPVLSALAERYPYRSTMVVCDIIRMVLVALIAIPGMPVWGMLALLFLTTLANPPSQAARSATLPQIFPDDRLVLALSVNSSSGQVAQVIGYAAGATIAAFNPAVALLINSATFAVSALLIRFGVRLRAAVSTGEPRHLIRETGEGFRMVFGTPVLRAIAVVVFASMLFSIVPEGLAAAWADDLTTTEAGRGAAQAIIMVSNPVGFILGSLVVGRLLRPATRRAIVRPFAILGPLMLVPALLNPSPVVVALLSAASGFAVAGMLPVANGLFVQALPEGYRARAFGVMNTGMQVIQGGAVLLTGVLAGWFGIADVVGWWCLAGVLLMVVLTRYWPSDARFDAAIAAARAPRPTQPAHAQDGPPSSSNGQHLPAQGTAGEVRPDATRTGPTTDARAH
ncbi:MFS transporter [Plantactinospora sp. GCM10030261]|uniref:MFS transporter n=1 Tax=Plantactinospora sp. GCM10030261 TaxID=3273420 RepID=UPI0036105536